MKDNDASRALEWLNNKIAKLQRISDLGHGPMAELDMLKSIRADVASQSNLADAIIEVISDCNHYKTAPPWEITYKLSKALAEWQRKTLGFDKQETTADLVEKMKEPTDVL